MIASNEFESRRKALSLLLFPALPACQEIARLKYGELPPGFRLQPLMVFENFAPREFELRLPVGENDLTRRKKYEEANAAIVDLVQAFQAKFKKNFKNDAGALGLKFRPAHISGHLLRIYVKKTECRYLPRDPVDFSIKYGLITIWLEGEIYAEAGRTFWGFESRIGGSVGGYVDLQRDADKGYQRLMTDFTTAMRQSGLLETIK